MARLGRLFAGATATLLFSAGGASAQQAATDEERNIGVLERPRPEYEAIGIRAGAFKIFPKLTLSGLHDSNVYATEVNEEADIIIGAIPEISVVSDWPRHAVELHGRAIISRYLENSAENSEDYVVGGSGRLDVLRSTTLRGGAEYSDLTEPRTVTNTVRGVRSPIEYDLTRAFVEGEHNFVNVGVLAGLEFRRYDYQNGTNFLNQRVSQDDRDRETLDASVRVGYNVSPDTSLFVRVAANDRDYRLRPPFVPFERDSSGYQVTAGSIFQITQLIRGDVQVGYLHQDYESPFFSDVNGLALRADVDWYVTQLTNVGFGLTRTVEEAADPRASSYVSTAGSVQVDHELRRNIILTALLRYEDDEYRGIDRRDEIWGATISGTYLMNRRVGVTAGYGFLQQDSRGVDRVNDFDVHRLSLSLVLQY